MSDGSNFSGGSNRLGGAGGFVPGRPAPVGRPGGPPVGTPGDPRPAEREAASGRARRDPFDMEGAMARLKTLLAFDGGRGPRDGVARRGFYLNILT